MKPFLVESVAFGDHVIDQRRSPCSVRQLQKPNVFGSSHPKEKFNDRNQALVGGSNRYCHARDTRHGSR
jgi:hypothetical protein